MKSYCQFKEDIFALNFVQNILKKDKGYFVDIGANDGITGSNSMLLEENGWDGILVEPNPNLLQVLKTNRPKSKIYEYVVSDLKKVKFYCVVGEGNLHGLSRMDQNEEFEAHVEQHQGKIEEHEIDCITLDLLFKKAQAPKDLDFLSIDVEGHELTVLNTLNFEQYRPKLICLEDNSKGECFKCHEFLNDKGYVFIARTGVNDWYALPVYQKYFIASSLKARLTKMRWRLKSRLKDLLGLQKAKSHI